MAVILYYLPLNSAFGILLKVILVPLFGVSGVIVAFVPLDGRPIDVMTTNFVKALFSPNQYIYHRQGRKLSFSTVSVAKAPVVKKNNRKRKPMHLLILKNSMKKRKNFALSCSLLMDKKKVK